ncbi:MAG: tetratricopeptide repeat protein [Candidatus Omnitrophica bacterium]|jgi:tetratricopeptide (TPR) repeat protein|nr:tetratricopeptide repeat protein [Candidatus Omnitrophota bacterium]
MAKESKIATLVLLTTFLAFGNIYAQETAKELLEKGKQFYEEHKYDEAITEYNKAIELNPNYAEAYNNRGVAYNVKGSYDQAISDFTRAIEINPSYAEAYYDRAVAYYWKHEPDKGWDDMQKAEKLGAIGNPDLIKLFEETQE